MAVLFFLIMIILMLFISQTYPALVKLRSDYVELKSATHSEHAELMRLKDLEREYLEEAGNFTRMNAQMGEDMQELERLRVLESMYTSRYEEMTDARQVRARFLRHVEERMAQRNFAFDILENEGIFRLPNDVLFDSAQFMLKAQGIEALDALAGILSDVLPCYAGKRGSDPPGCLHPDHAFPGRFDVILIEGHTDNLRLLSQAKVNDNLQLSTFRSWSTYSHLLNAAPSLAELRNGEDEFLFGMSGYGEHRPVERDQATEDQRVRNRRVDFRIVLAAPEVSGNAEGSKRTGGSGVTAVAGVEAPREDGPAPMPYRPHAPTGSPG
jgi:flagellar motor protein MotB